MFEKYKSPPHLNHDPSINGDGMSLEALLQPEPCVAAAGLRPLLIRGS
jgi:hypothetical protein